MHVLKIFLAIICGTLIDFSSFGQISFYKIFTNNGYDHGQGVVQLEDSSYVICGSSSSFTEGPSQAFLLKIDSLGNYLWSQHYGGSESEWGRRVLYKNNVGFFIAGHTNSIGNGAYDVFLMKTDLNGALLWEKSYGGTEWEKINDAALMRDTGTLLVGQSNSTIGGDNDIYLIRTDSNGDTLWTKKFGGPGDDFATSITQFNDSTYFIGGQLYVEDSLASKGFVMRLTDNGVIQWFDTIGTNGNCGINGVDYDPNTNQVNFVGWEMNLSTNFENSYFGKIYSNGIVDFTNQESWTGLKIYDHITQYGSLGKNYVSYRYFDETSFQDGYNAALSRLMAGLYWDGVILGINYPLDDITGQLIPTSDGGVLAVGYISYQGAGGANVFAVKIGPNDEFPVIDPDPFPNPIVWISEQSFEKDILVYPNPVQDRISIRTDQLDKMVCTLKDMQGKMISIQEFYGSIDLEIDSVLSGMYILTISSEEKSIREVRRIVIH